MALFRKKAARVVRRSDAVEERIVQNVGDKTVTVRRFKAQPEAEAAPKAQQQKQRQSRSGGNSTKPRTGNRQKQKPRSQQSRNQKSRQRSDQGTRTQRRPRPHLEIVQPPETARKQMLVRSSPHQTQIVVLEGPVLVEHYVARSDQKSLVNNVYMGKVRNVLPGMEAAFVDFGEGKNGVLYAGDINYEEFEIEGKKKRIEMALKPGDAVLVQVVKDAMGHKGARLTNQISLAGRYLVLSPDADVRGISRRLSDDERRRLREIVGELRPKGMGVIVRTAAEGASRDDIEADIARLLEIWKDIEGKRDKVTAPALLYKEPPLVLRVIRENFTKDFRRLLIDDEKTYKSVLKYLEGTEADLKSKVQKYNDELSIFERFHVEDQLRKALDRKVWLPSGGHIVIDRTEALTVIDVNTGRFVGRSNLEETVLQNNLEAAEEVARQLRLRDIGGIIVIDFIDMEVLKNQEQVLLRFREHLAKDKMRTQVFDVSNLGLVEMTRKNVSAGLLESFSDICPTCSGRGILLHEDAAATGAEISAVADASDSTE
ncbi:MAG: Rne/Rng family ribonuclease [bacterium]|nr:Rne/Rng family ribonuclease [bacterium]